MKKHDVLGTVKFVGGIVISIGISAIAVNMIRATTPGNVDKFTNICIKVGGCFVGMAAAAEATTKFEGMVDEFDCIIEGIMEDDKSDEIGTAEFAVA